ncbi:hypothetical protein RIF29_39755 [Crotalaria pallida]|uniref:Uncharacterized protein n=1 Tax=Crotalaria pallida TaxID=3830 RepID=A0AAN9E2L5_CROPI
MHHTTPHHTKPRRHHHEATLHIQHWVLCVSSVSLRFLHAATTTPRHCSLLSSVSALTVVKLLSIAFFQFLNAHESLCSGGLRLKHDIPEYGEFVLLLLMRNLNCWAWHLKFWKKKPIGIEFAKHFKAHLGPIEGLVVSGDGLLFTTISDDSSVHIYDARGGKNDPIISKEIHLGPIKVMKYNLVYDSIISADVEGIIQYWSPSTLQFPKDEYVLLFVLL